MKHTEQQLISVILPVYNAEKTLNRAVQSVLTQTWTDLELIIVDDGSTDQTGVIADSLAAAHTQIRVIHTPDLGVSAARNTGLQAAAGAYLTFLDGDDAFAPDMLQRLFQLHEKTRADICGCHFRTISAGDAAGQADNARIREGSEIIRQCILASHDTRVWSKLYTRDIIGSHRFQEGLTIGEDMLFFLSLVTNDTRYALMDAPLYLYTVNPEGAMERPFTPAYMDQLRCWDLARDQIRTSFPDFLQAEDNDAMLSAIQTVSAVLTASKICSLPDARSAENRGYFETCRNTTREYLSHQGTRSHLPADYKVKSELLVRFPVLYRQIYHLAGTHHSAR